MHGRNIVQIDASVTEQQRNDPRFQTLLRDCEEGFNAPGSDLFKLLIGLHEAGHAYFARKAGATNIHFRGPTVLWDDRPQYNCPAISRAATIYVLPADREIWDEARRFVREIFPTEPTPNWVEVPRNEPCPCGSGKKFKKCHLAA